MLDLKCLKIHQFYCECKVYFLDICPLCLLQLRMGVGGKKRITFVLGIFQGYLVTSTLVTLPLGDMMRSFLKYRTPRYPRDDNEDFYEVLSKNPS